MHFLTRFFLITLRILLCCNISLEMFRGKSSESTTPLMKSEMETPVKILARHSAARYHTNSTYLGIPESVLHNYPLWILFLHTTWCCSFSSGFRRDQMEPSLERTAELWIPVVPQLRSAWQPSGLPSHLSAICKIPHILPVLCRLDFWSKLVWFCSVPHLLYIFPNYEEKVGNQSVKCQCLNM